MDYAATATREERTRPEVVRGPSSGLSSKITRETVLRLFSRAADAIDARPGLCTAFLVICFLATVVLESHAHPLTNDEIYTLHIAQSPTLGRMIALSREIDLHPPLHYLLERYALLLPAPRWLDARLPSILAGLVACLAVMRFTSRRLGSLFGLVAVTLLWFSPLLEFSWSNRPYELWLAFLCLLLPARAAAARLHRRWWSVALVFLCAFAMVMSHLIGVLCLGPFLLAELLRGYRNRRLDGWLLLALAAPALVAVGFHYQFSHLSKDAFPLDQMPSFGLAISTYVSNCGTTVQILGGVLLIFVLLVGPVSVARAKDDTIPARLPFDFAELVIFAGLLVLPLFVLLAGSVLHIQYWTRYGAAAVPAIAVLGTGLIACRMPFARPMAFLILLAGVTYMSFLMLTDTGRPGNGGMIDGGRWPIELSSLDPSLPIVAASPMTFIEMSDRETPAIAHRVFYLTDVDNAMRYSHYTLFENEDKIRALLNLPSQAEPLKTFLPQHHRFYIVGDYDARQIWLLRSLAAAGLHLDYLGKFDSTYESQDLYLVWY